MKPHAPILFLILCIACAARGDVPAGWKTNYTSALSEAARAKKPVLIYFTASWCGPCKLMSRLTLTNATVEQALSTIEHAAIDIDEHQDLASSNAIDAVPTFVMLSTSGDEVRRTTGFQTAGDFLRWLTNGISDAEQSAARHALGEKKLADVDRLLDSTDPESQRAAATGLFGLCGDRDEMIVRMAADRFKILALRAPAALLDGLNNPSLATRIRVANALHARLGDAFDVDPWGDPADRGKKIQQWRARLSAISSSTGP